MKNFDGTGIDRRQRVNLSDEAFSVIISDSFTFAGSGSISYSEIICRVFLMFVEQSAAKHQNQKQTHEFLARKPSQAQQKTPSLQNGVLDYLAQADVVAAINGKNFGGSPGKFIKAVIEEYAEMPFVEREKIFFNDILDKINNNLNKQLRIVTGLQTLMVRPYKIMPDKQSTYNYLVCYSANSNNPDKYNISSLRISRIKNVTVLKNTEFILDDNDVDSIKQSIMLKGIPFLRSNLCDIIVELTDIGKSLYNKMVFQRPEVNSIIDNKYYFRCTITQADIYFFKFGAEAQIIEPLELRGKFQERYNQAAKLYNDGDMESSQKQ